MNVGFLTGTTLSNFIEDKQVFDKCVNDYFKLVEASGAEGGFSKDMFRERFVGFFVSESNPQSKQDSERACDSIFEKYDWDKNGKIDRREFGLLLRDIMVAMVDSVGSSVGIVYLDRNGLISRAVQFELGKK